MIEIRDELGNLVFNQGLDMKNKRVLVSFESKITW